MNSLIVKNTIIINTLVSKVWDVLVNPEKTKKYMFGCEAVSEWKVGSQLLWKGTFKSEEMVFVKGNIVDIMPEKYLAYTTFDPNNTSIKDIQENYLTVTYELMPENGRTILNVSQGDFALVAEGEKRYKEASDKDKGWNPILLEIKKIAEAS
jgi:uncharacterized protein YndB with AHSA1/START domain